MSERERDEGIFNSVVEALSLDARIKIPLRLRSDSQSATQRHRASSPLGSLSKGGYPPPFFPPREPAMIAIVADDYKCESFHHIGAERRSFPRVFTGESGGRREKSNEKIAIDAIALCKRAASPVFRYSLRSKRAVISPPPPFKRPFPPLGIDGD